MTQTTENPNPAPQSTDAQAPPAGPQAPAFRAPFTKRLTRSRTDRMLGGVCGGIAEYLGVDPTLVRLGAVVLAIASGGAALIAYVAAWIIVPEA